MFSINRFTTGILPLGLVLCTISLLSSSFSAEAAREQTNTPHAPTLRPRLPDATMIAPPSTAPKSDDNPNLSPEDWADTVKEVRAHKVIMPIAGISPATLRGSFYSNRGTSMHRAVDILAPRNTPVLAVDDGTIGKLWLSQAGGITIYQMDSTGKYVYYYAHLERYADNLHNGDRVTKGQIIGYVGTSGDAPKNTPHLHFAIYKAPVPGQWWHGAPVDPWEVFSGLSASSPVRPSLPVRPSPVPGDTGTRLSPFFWI